jgi:chromate reductase
MNEECVVPVDDKTFRLLGLSGSIRQGSTNTIILRTLAERLQGTVSLTLFPLDEVPLYNGDLEGERQPDAVRALKAAIAASDGLVFCTPEFNHGIPGVLKNAIDWASRPAFASPLKNKPCLVMTSSPGYVGGARAQVQMLDTLSSVLARVVARPQVVIAGVLQKITDGRLVDADSVQFCLAAIDDLVKEIRLVSAHSA